MEIYRSEKGEMHFKHEGENRKKERETISDILCGVLGVFRIFEKYNFPSEWLFGYDHTSEGWEF